MKPNLLKYFSKNRPNGLRWPHAPIIAIANHKLLYCPIGKNGCTSLKRLMISLSDIRHKDRLLRGDIHQNLDRHRTGAQLMDRALDEARRIMEDDDYFKFAVVREPFSRLVSAYLEKFVINRLGKANQYHTTPVVSAVQGTPHPDFERGISFAEFIRHIVTQEPESLDPHWKPQSCYLRGIQYDRIYRMDQFDTLCQDLSQRVGHPVKLEMKNRSGRGPAKTVKGAAFLIAGQMPNSKSIDKRSFMDDGLMSSIEAFFRADIDLCRDEAHERGPFQQPRGICRDWFEVTPPENSVRKMFRFLRRSKAAYGPREK